MTSARMPGMPATPTGPFRWVRQQAKHLILRLLRARYARTSDGLSIIPVRSGPLRGRQMIVNLDPAIGQLDTSYIGGYRQEADEVALVAGLLRPGQSAWDIGIYRGVYTLLFAERVGPQGAVVAIDIDPDNCRIVGDVLTLNGFGNVTVRNFGISNENVAGTFISSPSSNSRLVGTFRGRPTDGVVMSEGERIAPVDVRTLDSLVDELGRADLIKIDIDGAEALALQAADRIFENGDLVLVVESHNPETDRALTGFLARHGCTVYSIQQRRTFGPGELVWGTVVACRNASRLEGLRRIA